jgi:hypothetical protein
MQILWALYWLGLHLYPKEIKSTKVIMILGVLVPLCFSIGISITVAIVDLKEDQCKSLAEVWLIAVSYINWFYYIHMLLIVGSQSRSEEEDSTQYSRFLNGKNALQQPLVT